MAGNGLMEGEGFHFPLGARVKIVSVHKIVAWTACRRRAGLIVSGGLRRRFEIGNGRDAVWIAGELAEFLDELRIDGLRDNFVSVDEVFGLVEIKPRIGSKKVGEIVEAAFEAGRSDELLPASKAASTISPTF